MSSKEMQLNDIDVNKLKELHRESEERVFKAIKNHFPLLKRCNKTWSLLYNIYRDGMKAGELLCLSFFKINKVYALELCKDEDVIAMMKRDVYKAFMSTICGEMRDLPSTYTTRYKKDLALFCWDSIGDGAGDLLSLFYYLRPDLKEGL